MSYCGFEIGGAVGYSAAFLAGTAIGLTVDYGEVVNVGLAKDSCRDVIDGGGWGGKGDRRYAHPILGRPWRRHLADLGDRSLGLRLRDLGGSRGLCRPRSWRLAWVVVEA